MRWHLPKHIYLITKLSQQVVGMVMRAPQGECATECDVRIEPQRILYAYGRLVCHAAAVAWLSVLDVASEAFVPGVGHPSRSVFAHLRQQADERGVRDVAYILKEDTDACQRLLRMFVEVPPVLSRGERCI